MSITLRKIIFWPHLVAGLIAGLIIAVMSFTGVCLAFEEQIVDWADRHHQRVEVPTPDATRLPIDTLLERVRTARPETPPSSVTVYPEPTRAVVVGLGRGSAVYVNPYTGEVQAQGAQGWRSFFHLMEEWHRWLGAQGDNRPVGRAITGASNTVFVLLAVSGLYLWWPRKWTWRTVRPTFWFKRGLKGKARDFNWHNVAGLWLLPVLLVLTVSGMVISYKWTSDLIFKLTGDTPPSAPGPFPPTPVVVPTPPEGTPRLALEPLFSEARKQVPVWENITLRLGGKPQAPTFSIREQGAWPLFASAQVSLDPFTGQVLLRESFADYKASRQVRTWMRFLHTGEAFGWVGQLIAAIASLGGLLLVWTGAALSWRRFFPRRQPRATSEEGGLPPEATEPLT